MPIIALLLLMSFLLSIVWLVMPVVRILALVVEIGVFFLDLIGDYIKFRQMG